MESTQDRWTPKFPAPVAEKDWVMEKNIQHPLLGKVRDVYWDGSTQEWVMDVALYRPDGEFYGRSSPAMGGPRKFEPAVPCTQWERIEKPSFPMARDLTGYRDWRGGAIVLPDRTEETENPA